MKLWLLILALGIGFSTEALRSAAGSTLEVPTLREPVLNILPRTDPDLHAAQPTNNLVFEIIKLLRRGVGTPVIESYITHWPTVYLTSAEDLLTLRKCGASTEVLNAFARRGAELRLSASLKARTLSNGLPEVIVYPAPIRTIETPRASEDFPYLFSEALPVVAEDYLQGDFWSDFFWRPPLRRPFHRR